MIKILVSIVNYNSYNDTIAVIDSIINKIDLIGYEVNFFIVDNSNETAKLENFLLEINQLTKFSSIDSVNNLEPCTNYVLKSINNGFGSANNITLNFAKNSNYYDVVWLLNNDLTLDVDVLSSLSQYMINDMYQLLGSTIYENDGPVLGTINMNGLKGYGTPKNIDLLSDIYLVDAVVGTSMFIKVKFIEDLRFDERFFMYVEENDFCYRLKEKNVFSYMVKKSKVFHEGGKTFGNNQAVRWYYKTRNLLFFKSKNDGFVIPLSLYLLIITFKNYPLNKSFLKACFFGIIDFRKGRFGPTRRKF